MRVLREPIRLALVSFLFLAAAPWAFAQGVGSAKLTSGSDRLFQAFIEDAALVDNQWWEAQLEFDDGDLFDLWVLRGVVAFQPWKDIELGARVGFGSSDSGESGIEDGSGATDLDAWGKYYIGSSGDAEFAVGAVATVPTGDDTVGLGADAFSLGAFGAMRYRLSRATLSTHVGLRSNGDGRIGGFDLSGKSSLFVGAGLIYPHSDTISFVGELNYEGERFEGGEADTRALAGLNWRLANRGQIRGALALGLSDGAPDVLLLAGYAANF